MKKLILIISLFSCVACKCLNKKSETPPITITSYKPLSSFNKDTINYVKNNFIKHKEEFIGKEFGLFLKYFDVPIKRYYSSIGYPPYSFYSNISIQLYNDITVENKIKMKVNPLILTITWETPIQPAEMDKLRLLTHNNWTTEAAAFFSKQKVKNIQMVDYGF